MLFDLRSHHGQQVSTTNPYVTTESDLSPALCLALMVLLLSKWHVLDTPNKLRSKWGELLSSVLEMLHVRSTGIYLSGAMNCELLGMLAGCTNYLAHL